MMHLVLVVLGMLATVTYLAAVVRVHRRGDQWPAARTFCMLATVAVLVSGGAVVRRAGGEFTEHVGQHLLVGMIAPLLLVLARPVTLALRAAPVGRTRRTLVRLLRSRLAATVVFPPFAGLLDVGFLWLFYRTRIYALAQEHPLLHILVHVHMFAAGALFSLAICQLEPLRHRYGTRTRGAVLVAAGAGHALLAKTLYATPPPGLTPAPADVARGAELMYYGGDLVEIALAAVVAWEWFRAAARQQVAPAVGACTTHRSVEKVVLR